MDNESVAHHLICYSPTRNNRSSSYRLIAILWYLPMLPSYNPSKYLA